MNVAGALAGGEVHLWLVDPGACRQPGLCASYGRLLLSAGEREVEQRFLFEADRHRYRVTRALVRCVLSRYASVAPEQWEFGANAYGKPCVANPQAAGQRLEFNVSHSADLVALAVVLDGAVGVDVEAVTRRAPMEVAHRCFNQEESAALAQCGASEQEQRFWSLWTLKESYLKARGTGLSLPLDSFRFELSAAGAVRMHCTPACGDSAERWRFSQWQPDPRHIAALCIKRTQRSSGQPPAIAVRQVVPLQGEQLLPSPAWSSA